MGLRWRSGRVWPHAVAMKTRMLVPAMVAVAALAWGAQSPWVSAQTVYVESHSGFLREAEVERELLKDAVWTKSGMTLTRDRTKADLVLEVRRKAFTSSFTVTVVDRRTQAILASERSNSIGGHIEPKLAKDFAKMLKAHR